MQRDTREFRSASHVDLLLGGYLPPAVDFHPPDLTPPEKEVLQNLSMWAENTDGNRIVEAGVVDGTLLKELHDIGATRITIPAAYGGLGFSDDCLLAALVILCRAHPVLSEIVGAHLVVGLTRPLLRYGTPTQISTYLPRCSDGLSAFALNEEDSGYDSVDISTTAEYDPGSGTYVLKGKKTWITNAPVASQVMVIAQVPPHSQGQGGPTAFIVTGDDRGFVRGPQSHFVGLRGLPNGSLSFDAVALSADRRLGQEGDGLDITLGALAECRQALPTVGLATIQSCLDRAHQWCNDPRQTRRGLERQAQTGQHLARLSAIHYQANALAWHTSQRTTDPLDREAAKLLISELAVESTDRLLQLYGGRGYETSQGATARGAQPLGIEELWRDTRVMTIFDSSTELIMNVIAQPADRPSPAAGHGAPPGSSRRRQLIADRAAQAAHYLFAGELSTRDAGMRAAGATVALSLYLLSVCVQYADSPYGDGESWHLEESEQDLLHLADQAIAVLRDAHRRSRSRHLAEAVKQRAPVSDYLQQLMDFSLEEAG